MVVGQEYQLQYLPQWIGYQASDTLLQGGLAQSFLQVIGNALTYSMVMRGYCDCLQDGKVHVGNSQCDPQG